MSTYKSKYSGAEIDELLTAVKEGNVGGGSSNPVHTAVFNGSKFTRDVYSITTTDPDEIATMDALSTFLRANLTAIKYITATINFPAFASHGFVISLNYMVGDNLELNESLSGSIIADDVGDDVTIFKIMLSTEDGITFNSNSSAFCMGITSLGGVITVNVY